MNTLFEKGTLRINQFNEVLEEMATREAGTKHAYPSTPDERLYLDIIYGDGGVMSFTPDELLEELAAAIIQTRQTDNWPTAHRYTLHRYGHNQNSILWQGGKKTIGWVLCNPSTATEEEDDATIRRVIGFSDRENATEILITNLIPYRATNPADLDDLPDWKAFGKVEIQKRAFRDMFRQADLVVFAWGSLCAPHNRRRALFNKGITLLETAYLQSHAVIARRPKLFHLGFGKSGHPKHPLYLAKENPFIPFSAADLMLYAKQAGR